MLPLDQQHKDTYMLLRRALLQSVRADETLTAYLSSEGDKSDPALVDAIKKNAEQRRLSTLQMIRHIEKSLNIPCNKRKYRNVKPSKTLKKG